MTPIRYINSVHLIGVIMTDKLNIATTGDIGALVKKRRSELSLSQSDLAKKIGASRRWVSDIEGGKETSEIGRVILTLRTLGMKLSIAPTHRDDQLDHCDAKAVSLDPSMLRETSIRSSTNTDAFSAKEMLVHRHQLGSINRASETIATTLKNDVLQAIEDVRSLLGLPENIRSITSSVSPWSQYMESELISSGFRKSMQCVPSLDLPENVKSITSSMSHAHHYIERVLGLPSSTSFSLEQGIAQSIDPVYKPVEKLQSHAHILKIWTEKNSDDE